MKIEDNSYSVVLVSQLMGGTVSCDTDALDLELTRVAMYALECKLITCATCALISCSVEAGCMFQFPNSVLQHA